MRGRKHTLICEDAGNDCEILVSEADLLLKESITDCRRGAEDGYERSRIVLGSIGVVYE